MATPVSSSPSTSAAVNIQIIEPKNYPAGTPKPHSHGPTAPGQPQGPGATPQPPQGGAANPQQALQDSYSAAINARQAAEQARSQYLNMANQLNNQPAQPQAQPFPPQQQPYPAQAYPAQPYPQQAQQQPPFAQGFYPPGYQPQQQAGAPYSPGAYPGYFPQIQYPQAQQQQQAFADPSQQIPQQQPADPTQQSPQQQPLDPAQQQAQAQQQAAADPAQQAQQQPADPFDPTGKSVEELNQWIANPQSLQQKLNAMEEIGVQGQATPETYQLLTQEALTDTSQLPPGQQKTDADYLRSAALWTLGMLNRAQNAQMPTEQLPGFDAARTILGNPNEDDNVQLAAVQFFQALGRQGDKAVQKALKPAAGRREQNEQVRELAKQAKSGQGIPGLDGQNAQPGAIPAAAGAPPDPNAAAPAAG